MNRFLFLLICMFVFLNGNSQTFYPPIVNYSTHDYSSKDYPMSPENFSVIQDQNGLMYFGNSNGVLQYDGVNWRFTEVQLGYYVRSLALDSSQHVHVGTYNDFGYLIANQQGELEYHTLTYSLTEDEMFFSDVMAIYANKEEVFYQSNESVFIFNMSDSTVKQFQQKHLSIPHLW